MRPAEGERKKQHIVYIPNLFIESYGNSVRELCACLERNEGIPSTQFPQMECCLYDRFPVLFDGKQIG